MPAANTPETFWARVDRSGGPDACWPWQGHVASNGYGLISWGCRHKRTHRLAWELTVGPIPARRVLDHKCRNRLCCNPKHLRVVTRKVNSLENSIGATAKHAAKTHCHRGHPLSGVNLGIEIDKRGRLGRRCKQCARDRKSPSITGPR